jgi:hypothetical protein
MTAPLLTLDPDLAAFHAGTPDAVGRVLRGVDEETEARVAEQPALAPRLEISGAVETSRLLDVR